MKICIAQPAFLRVQMEGRQGWRKGRGREKRERTEKPQEREIEDGLFEHRLKCGKADSKGIIFCAETRNRIISKSCRFM